MMLIFAFRERAYKVSLIDRLLDIKAVFEWEKGQTRHIMHVQRNIEARSRIIVAVEKTINITYSCVCAYVRACSLAYPACNLYAPYCVVICSLSGSTTFFDIIS